MAWPCNWFGVVVICLMFSAWFRLEPMACPAGSPAVNEDDLCNGGRSPEDGDQEEAWDYEGETSTSGQEGQFGDYNASGRLAAVFTYNLEQLHSIEHFVRERLFPSVATVIFHGMVGRGIEIFRATMDENEFLDKLAECVDEIKEGIGSGRSCQVFLQVLDGYANMWGYHTDGLLMLEPDEGPIVFISPDSFCKTAMYYWTLMSRIPLTSSPGAPSMLYSLNWHTDAMMANLEQILGTLEANLYLTNSMYQQVYSADISSQIDQIMETFAAIVGYLDVVMGFLVKPEAEALEKLPNSEVVYSREVGLEALEAVFVENGLPKLSTFTEELLFGESLDTDAGLEFPATDVARYVIWYLRRVTSSIGAEASSLSDQRLLDMLNRLSGAAGELLL